MSNTATLSQQVTLPAGSAKSLSFYVRIDTAEKGAKEPLDTLQVVIVAGRTTTTLATYSNLDRGPDYVRKGFSLASFAGERVVVGFIGTENASLETSFVIDDVAVS